MADIHDETIEISPAQEAAREWFTGKASEYSATARNRWLDAFFVDSQDSLSVTLNTAAEARLIDNADNPDKFVTAAEHMRSAVKVRKWVNYLSVALVAGVTAFVSVPLAAAVGIPLGGLVYYRNKMREDASEAAYNQARFLKEVYEGRPAKEVANEWITEKEKLEKARNLRRLEKNMNLWGAKIFTGISALSAVGFLTAILVGTQLALPLAVVSAVSAFVAWVSNMEAKHVSGKVEKFYQDLMDTVIKVYNAD